MRRVTHQLAWRFGVVLFSVAFIGVAAFCLFIARRCVTAQAWGRASGQRSILAIYVCAFTCGRSFTVCSGCGVFSFWSFLVFFSHPPFPCLLLCITIVVYCLLLLLFSTELLALCDGCLGWGWVWWAGLVAELRVGQAFGMFLLPWVWGRQLQPLGSWAPNLHVRLVK